MTADPRWYMGDHGPGSSRRTFLFGAAGLAIAGNPPASRGRDRVAVQVLLDETIGANSPDNFGYLLENIGTSIYDGKWVGEGSSILNIGGIRKDLTDHLRGLQASVIRWPGDNFADHHDWRDGVGPHADRPVRTIYWVDAFPVGVAARPQRFDPTHFATNEFMQLCQLSGGRPFLSANVRGMGKAVATLLRLPDMMVPGEGRGQSLGHRCRKEEGIGQ